MERFACPTPDHMGRYRCIDDHVLCDGFIDCPEGEDEDRQACMFYKTVRTISALFQVFRLYILIKKKSPCTPLKYMRYKLPRNTCLF